MTAVHVTGVLARPYVSEEQHSSLEQQATTKGGATRHRYRYDKSSYYT